MWRLFCFVVQVVIDPVFMLGTNKQVRAWQLQLA